MTTTQHNVLQDLGFSPDVAYYTPDNGFTSTWIMMFIYSVVGLSLSIAMCSYDKFHPFQPCKCNRMLKILITQKYNSAGWHFVLICITWFVFAIRHFLHEEDATAHLVVQIIWSILYHLSILFYLFSIGPPPDSSGTDKTEWGVFVVFALFLVLGSFVVDLMFLQSMACFILWFIVNGYLFIYTLLESYALGCGMTPFYYHASVLFSVLAAVVMFVPFRFFNGFESSGFVNNYVLCIGCFIISTLFYFGGLVLEAKDKLEKQLRQYADDARAYEVVPINPHDQ
eukprot:238273_1